MHDYLKPFFNRCEQADFLFFKVLSQNDRSWSWPKERKGYSHQGGILIPDNCTRIFPRNEVEHRTGTHLLGDRYYRIRTFWLEEDGEWDEFYQGHDWRRQSKFGRSYRDRDEFRITGGLPPNHFRDLQPGSLFACARQRGSNRDGEYVFSCITVDADRDAYDELIQTLIMPDPPWAGILDITDFHSPDDGAPSSKTLAFAAEVLSTAARLGEPPPSITTAEELVKAAVRTLESRNNIGILDLFRNSPNPGDEIRELMDEGFSILREQQQRVYPAKLADVLWSSFETGGLSRQALIDAFRRNAEDIRGIFKSMQNSIFSLAGKCFQEYIDLWLKAFSIPREQQQEVDGERVPDFVIPGVAYYWSDNRGRDDAILLAAKTSCRERWQQILAEGKRVDTRYLITLDNAVPQRTLNKMKEDRVVLIVPESEKASLEHYKASEVVLDYKTFMKRLLRLKASVWK